MKVKENELWPGRKVRNYRGMCALLEDKEYTNQVEREKQFARWREYFSWRKIGHVFEITEVKVTTKSVQSSVLDTITSERDFIRLLSYHLLLILHEDLISKEMPLYYTFDELAKLLGLVNQNFPPTEKKLKKARIKSDEKNLAYFCGDMKNHNRTAIRAAFVRLKKDLCAISFGESWLAVTTDNPEKLLSESESYDIIDIQNETLAEFKLTGMSRVKYSRYREEFWQTLRNKLRERMGIYHCEEVITVYALRKWLENGIAALERELPYLAGYYILTNEFAVGRARIRQEHLLARETLQLACKAEGELLTTYPVEVPESFREVQESLRRNFVKRM